MRRTLLTLAALGCTSRQSSSSSGGGSPGAASGSSTGGASTTASAGTTGTASGGSSSGARGSGSTGGAYRSPFVDGGYVFCTLPDAADAGPHGDGGRASWFCQPGTYFCDPSGNLGNCTECRTDGDCAKSDLPTYDPGRPRCDVNSGLAGYQGFCQECLGDPDCAGNPSGPHCDVDTGAVEPSIERLGFETCGLPPKPPPPLCFPEDYLHDGGCTPSVTCQTDQDCAGLVTHSQMLVPYCVQGVCGSCPNAYCPGALCFADQCAPLGSDGGLTCNMGYFECGCTGDEACGGFWPLCMGLDSGFTNGVGQPAGLCGCDRDEQCGDGGLSCIQQPGLAGSFLLGYCGVACQDPRLPACSVFTRNQTPVCDAYSHVCEPCAADGECQNQAGGETGPYCRPDGTCGCKISGDCPSDQTCQAPYEIASDQARLGFCASPPPLCTPASCNGDLCDPDGGCEPGVACATDYDCSIAGRYDPFCEVDAGVCRQCMDDQDCLRGGFGADVTTCNSSSVCIAQCVTDLDCVGNPLGSMCLTARGDLCGCGSDRDCAGNPAGPHCDTNSQDGLFGLCTCDNVSECPPGDACRILTATSSECGSTCASDVDCPLGFFCDITGSCRPRCDPGMSCVAPDPFCDVDNVVGHNGEPTTGEGSPVWCYQCFTAYDCDAGLGCLTSDNYSCGACRRDPDCRSGEMCLNGVCHPACDAGACAPGQVCDELGLAGLGAGICYQCVGPEDCPDGLGCDAVTRTCGTCRGPTAKGGPFDCPPGAICSNYWASVTGNGVCLQNCDEWACPPGQTCDWFPSLTPDHKYCFGCLRDSDCADAGAGAWCDTSVDLTFTCRPAPP